LVTVLVLFDERCRSVATTDAAGRFDDESL